MRRICYKYSRDVVVPLALASPTSIFDHPRITDLSHDVGRLANVRPSSRISKPRGHGHYDLRLLLTNNLGTPGKLSRRLEITSMGSTG